ncbi:MAG TPA: DUF4252 domain-containing protein [Thermoanaerobaculia bacterium]|jgi:hypothetical protein|nr:DUF4252 domain-containing protein [Thermoanaerobaculia bacterium]
MNRQTVPFLIALALAALTTGCAGGPSVDTVRWEIERRIPEARFEPEEHIRLGRISMGLIHGILRMVPDAEEGRQIVNEVHRVEVATYRVKSLPNLDRLDRLGSETGFEHDLARAGWTMAVRTRDKGERTWIFLHDGEGGSLSNLFVVSLDKSELTLVRLDGRLDRAFAAAVAEHPQKMAKQIGAGD